MIRYSTEIINTKTNKREYYNLFEFHKNVEVVDYNYTPIPKEYDRTKVIFQCLALFGHYRSLICQYVLMV